MFVRTYQHVNCTHQTLESQLRTFGQTVFLHIQKLTIKQIKNYSLIRFSLEKI